MGVNDGPDGLGHLHKMNCLSVCLSVNENFLKKVNNSPTWVHMYLLQLGKDPTKPLRPTARMAAQGQVIIMMMVIPWVSLPSIGVRTARQPGPSQCEPLNMKIWPPPAYLRCRVRDLPDKHLIYFAWFMTLCNMEKAKLVEIQPSWNEFQGEKYKFLCWKDVILHVYAIKMELVLAG